MIEKKKIKIEITNRVEKRLAGQSALWLHPAPDQRRKVLGSLEVWQFGIMRPVW